MNLIPEFQIGLSNAWWLSSVYIVINFLLIVAIPKDAAKRLMKHPTTTRSEKIILKVQLILFFGNILYTIFVTLKTGTAWFWSGLLVFTVGMIAYIISMINYAATPQDQPVVKGMYRISRNPIHVSSFIAWLGVGIATASWVILLVSIFEQILMHNTTLAEERFCLENYGDSYRKYMEEVPRYFLFF